MARYLPIAEHGLIGDLHTVALVGTGRDDRLVLLPTLRLADTQANCGKAVREAERARQDSNL
jgi:hypothetical protein